MHRSGRLIKGLLLLLCAGFLIVQLHYHLYAKYPKDSATFTRHKSDDIQVHYLQKISYKRLLNFTYDISYSKQNGTKVTEATQKPMDRLKPIPTKSTQIPNPIPEVFSDNLPLKIFNPNCSANYSTFQTESYCLPHPTVDTYFKFFNTELQCHKHGTAQFKIDKGGAQCVCHQTWHNMHCSMPDVVYYSDYPKTHGYFIAKHPHRIVHAFPFTHEFGLLEARLYELYEVVDLFVILESNYTASGKPKPRLLWSELTNGYLQAYQSKIFYVSLDFFPKLAYYNGWVADALLRDYIAPGALSKLENLREDDIFLLTDADELPLRDAIFFLKFHTGYPEPVGFNLIHNVYTFFWQGTDYYSHTFGACTMKTLLHFFRWQPYRLRSASKQMMDRTTDLKTFKLKHHPWIGEWSFGLKELNKTAGWHCSWCLPPFGIKLKLDAAHWSDLPRWGAYPSKSSEDYITALISRGLWFDDRTHLLPVTGSSLHVPQFFQKNPDRFPYLIQNGTYIAKNSTNMFSKSKLH